MDSILEDRHKDYGVIYMKVMIPDGGNSQRDVSIVSHDPGPVKGALANERMITGGWNRKESIIQN